LSTMIVLSFMCFSIPFSSPCFNVFLPLLHFWFKYQRRQIPKNQSTADSRRAGGKSSFKKSQESFLLQPLLNALKKGVSKSQERHRGAIPRPFDKRIVHPEKSENCAAD